jgi:GDPmannose 4,6-dehydratase
LDWQEYVHVDKCFLRPLDVPCLVGDHSKAERKLGWRPTTKFDELIKIMVREEVNRWERWHKGEKFPWDAPSYPNENRILTRLLRV